MLKKAISQTEADILELVQTVVTGLVHIVIIDARFSCKAAAEAMRLPMRLLDAVTNGTE